MLRDPVSGRPGLIVNTSAGGSLLADEAEYGAHCHAMNPFTDMPAGEVLTADELLGEATLLTHAFYRQYLHPLDLRYIVATRLRTDDGVECALFASRRHDGCDFDGPDKALIAKVVPHLRRAVSLHSKLDVLESERRVYASTIDRMRVGTIVLDEHGKVLESNGAAERLIAAHDGLRVSHGILQPSCPIENRGFQQLVQAALHNHMMGTAGRTEAVILMRPDGRKPLSVLMRPIPLNYCSEEKQRRPAVAVFIRDPEDSPKTSHEMLRKLFRLTPSETEVALLLVDGLTIDEAAAAMGVMKNTVRAHLRGVFAKTGATRQSVLVKTLLNSVVTMV